MFGKCWSIQYINNYDYKVCDKVHTAPVYFTANATVKAIHEWIALLNQMSEENETTKNTCNISHITEEFLSNTEPGYWDEIYKNDNSITVVIICHRIA